MLNGDVRKILACIVSVIENLCEEYPKKLIKDCIDIAFMTDKEKVEALKKQKTEKEGIDKMLKKLTELLEK